MQRYGPVIEQICVLFGGYCGVYTGVSGVSLYDYPAGSRILLKGYKEDIQNRWLNLKAWFVGRGNQDSESYKLLDITNGIIRKITRYAYRIAESQNRSINRKKEYMQLCKLFAECKDIKEAHSLSAAVFGVMHTRHVVGDFERETESIFSRVVDEDAFEVEIKPRTRKYREKSYTASIRSRKEESSERWRNISRGRRKNRRLLLSISRTTI